MSQISGRITQGSEGQKIFHESHQTGFFNVSLMLAGLFFPYFKLVYLLLMSNARMIRKL